MWKVFLLFIVFILWVIASSDNSQAISYPKSGTYGYGCKGCAASCGKNEVYSSCTNGGCDGRYCSQLGKPVPCVKLDPKYCRKGCVCARGYLQAANGKCVKNEQCDKPRKCTNKNEQFDYCPAPCPPQICGVDPALVLCAPSPKYGDPACKPGCRCVDGFVRNADNECIPRESCPKPGCGGDPNAKSGCGVNCGRTCATYDKGPVACPLYCKLDGCDCIDGYVLDPVVGKCVLPKDCTPQCAPNEIPSNCSNGGCGPFTCSDLGYPIKCVRPRKCQKGCICQNTYVRDNSGTCVPKDQCTGPCGGDSNAQPGCGVNCGKTCSTYKAKNPRCPRICFPNSCDCKPGFVKDPNVGRCVLPKDCTPECERNDIPSKCSNGDCGPFTCSDLAPACGVKETYCPCAEKCVCQKEYYARTSDGKCMPKS